VAPRRLQAQRAAEIVRDGAGRWGQRRRQVRDAHADLAAFAQRWHPALPGLPTDPEELATEVRWLHGRRVEDPINAYVARQVADAHPDADQIRDAERDANTAYNRAEQAASELDEAIYAELRSTGRAGLARNPAGRLRAVAEDLADVERDLRSATALHGEPSLRTLPADGLDGEHQRWAADRAARQQAASRAAQQRRQSRQDRRRIEPPPPTRTTPDHGRGIGR
jgi:exodeoxyribonuclease V alpha subunit